MANTVIFADPHASITSISHNGVEYPVGGGMCEVPDDVVGVFTAPGMGFSREAPADAEVTFPKEGDAAADEAESEPKEDDASVEAEAPAEQGSEGKNRKSGK